MSNYQRVYRSLLVLQWESEEIWIELDWTRKSPTSLLFPVPGMWEKQIMSGHFLAAAQGCVCPPFLAWNGLGASENSQAAEPTWLPYVEVSSVSSFCPWRWMPWRFRCICCGIWRSNRLKCAEWRLRPCSGCTSPSAAPVSWTPWCTCPEIVLDGQRTWVWTMTCLANASKMLLGQCARCGVIKHVCIATETHMKLISFWMKKPTRSTRESSWHCSGSQSNVCCLLGMMTPTSFGQTLLSLGAPRIARLKDSCPWRNFRDTLAIGKQSSWWAKSLPPPHRPMSRWHWSAWGKALLSWVCKKSGRFPSACSTRNSEDPVDASNFWTPNPRIAEQTLQALMKRRFWMAGWMKWIVLSMQRPSKSSTRIWRNLAFHMKVVQLVMRKLV